MTILNDAPLSSTLGSGFYDPGCARSGSLYCMLVKMVFQKIFKKHSQRANSVAESTTE